MSRGTISTKSLVIILFFVNAVPALAGTVSVWHTPIKVHVGANGSVWHTPIVHYNNDTYVTYVDEALNTIVAKRDSAGNWQYATIKTGTSNDPGHNESSIAIDGDGYIHVWYDMHTEGMKYSRSNQPGSLAGGFTNRASEFPTGAYTYPAAVTAPNGDIYMAARNYFNGYGCELFRWDNSANTWSEIADGFAKESGYVCYIPNLEADSTGAIHISWSWAQTTPRPERHIGSYAKYDPVTNTFYKADGTPYTLPITRATADIFQPLENGEAWTNYGVNYTRITVDPTNKPLIVYGYSIDRIAVGTTDVRLAEWSGSSWSRTTLLQDELSAASHSADITYNGGVRVYAGKSDDNVYRWTRAAGSSAWTTAPVTTNGEVRKPKVATVDGLDYLYLDSSHDTGNFYIGMESYTPPMNAALGKPVTVDSSYSTFTGNKAVDGEVSDESRWVSANTSGPHWMEIDFGQLQTIGSATVYTGHSEGNAVSTFKLQAWNGTGWTDIAGTAVSGNTTTVVSQSFNPITTSKVRFYSTDNGYVRVKEIQLFTSPMNAALGKTVTSDSSYGTFTGDKAVDGVVSDDSRWVSANTSGPHWVEIDLGQMRTIGSAGIYTGHSDGNAVSSFKLQAWNGSSWADIAGTPVTGNTSTFVSQTFDPVTTSKVRFYSTDNGHVRVKEIQLFTI